LCGSIELIVPLSLRVWFSHLCLTGCCTDYEFIDS